VIHTMYLQRSNYEKPNSGESCTWSNAVGRWDNQSGCRGIRKNSSPTSRFGPAGRKKTRSRVCVDQWLLQVEPRTRRKKRKIHVDFGQVETSAAFGCGMGFTTVAPRPRRLHLCSGPLALMASRAEHNRPEEGTRP
jgi:hypothetical protein